jgi:hypothetical protein
MEIPHNRWCEPTIIEVEWREKYAPTYVDLDEVNVALNIDRQSGDYFPVVCLACHAEQMSSVFPGPPYSYWVVRVLMLDIVNSKANGTIVANVLASHGMVNDGDTAESVKFDFLANVGRFLAKAFNEDPEIISCEMKEGNSDANS